MPLFTAINFVCAVITLSISIVFLMYRLNKKKAKTMSVKELIGFDLTVSFFVPEGKISCVSLHQPDKTKIPYGWAMISEIENEKSGRLEATLWMIFIREEFRGKGLAKKLVSFLQTRYDFISTQYENHLVSSAGVKLCMSCGFIIKPSMFKRHPSILSWEKDKNNVK